MRTLRNQWLGLVICGILLAAVATSFFWLKQETTPVDLQKDYLTANTDVERDEVIRRLEEYYLNLAVPDSIIRRVEDEVGSLLETTKIDPTAYSKDKWDTNIYKLENQLRDLLKASMIARGKEDEAAFRELMTVATEIAETVDEETGADYWVEFVLEKSKATKRQAVAWLKAERAARLCSDFHFSDRWKEAEWYGALGYTHLSETGDVRLKLDILHRLQYMLYYFRGLFDLSVALADRSLKKANDANYILRGKGIAYTQADALFENGRIVEALDSFQRLKNSAERHSQVPAMEWYLRKSSFRIANCYWRLGRLQEALALLKELEGFELDSSDKILLNTSRGLINRRLGNYVRAEFEYNTAITIADSINAVPNQIRILNNIGFMYSELTEYDEALKYFSQVQTLLDRFFPKSAEYRINLLVNMAQVKQKQGETKTVAVLINEANKLLGKLGALPNRKADILLTLGKVHSDIGQDLEAIKTLRQAEALCDEYGLTRLSLESKLKLAESMMRLGEYSDAKGKLSETVERAKQYKDTERLIDSLSLLAEIAHKEGKLEKAVATSNRLVSEIETVIGQGFAGSRRLISYHQKIYDYLKKGVTYEVLLGRLDSAFIKLDYAKSLSSRYPAAENNGVYPNAKANPAAPFSLDRLKSQIGKQRLLLNFMLTNDELYLFALQNNRLQLFTKEIDSDSLRKRVNEYIDTLSNTVGIFDRYEVHTIDSHFKNTVQLGYRLFQDLMGWPDLSKSLKMMELIYVVPDEFLYKLPFSTLVLKDSEPVNYLVHNVAVVNLQNAPFFESKNRWLNKSDTKNLSALLSFDPNFQEMRKFAADIGTRVASYQTITINKEEVEIKDIIHKLNENFDMYIFLGHSVANPIEPELSYIEVHAKSSLRSDFKTLKLRLSDIRTLDWSSPRMVLLVGCETAGGKLYRGSGFLGLQYALLSKGVQNVIASLWKIDAAHSIAHARDYMNLYLQGFNPSLALRKAQINSINYLSGHSYYRKPHPYFWGSHSLYSARN